LSCLLKEPGDLLTANAGKVVQKLVEAIAAFEIIDQRLDRHPGAYEDWGSAQDLGV